MELVLGLNWQLAAVSAILSAFGVLYNALVERLERGGHDRGYMSFIVAFGVAVTLSGAIPLVGWRTVALITLLFACSGTPMIIGSVVRYARERRRDESALRHVVEEMFDDGDPA